jgi:hypothetical protein
MFRNVVSFRGEELLILRSTTELKDNPLSVIRDCLYSRLRSIFEAVPPSAT